MPRKTRVTEYFVVVTPYAQSWIYREEEQRLKAEKRICEQICTEIKRHVDDVLGVSVEAESEEICEYCGSRWTEPGRDYNGGCCDSDIANHEGETLS